MFVVVAVFVGVVVDVVDVCDLDICSWSFAYFQSFEPLALILTNFQMIRN